VADAATIKDFIVLSIEKNCSKIGTEQKAAAAFSVLSQPKRVAIEYMR
jgi:hypothetical protein